MNESLRKVVMPHSRAARGLAAYMVSSSCWPVAAENAERAPLCLCVLVVAIPSASTSQPPRHQDTKRPSLLHPRLRPYGRCTKRIEIGVWLWYMGRQLSGERSCRFIVPRVLAARRPAEGNGVAHSLWRRSGCLEHPTRSVRPRGMMRTRRVSRDATFLEKAGRA